MHAVVNRIDPVRCSPGLIVGAEAETQHRIEGVAKPPHPTPAIAAKAAVVSDTPRHQRVRELEKDGRGPGERHYNDLALDFVGDAPDAARCVARMR